MRKLLDDAVSPSAVGFAVVSVCYAVATWVGTGHAGRLNGGLLIADALVVRFASWIALPFVLGLALAVGRRWSSSNARVRFASSADYALAAVRDFVATTAMQLLPAILMLVVAAGVSSGDSRTFVLADSPAGEAIASTATSSPVVLAVVQTLTLFAALLAVGGFVVLMCAVFSYSRVALPLGIAVSAWIAISEFLPFGGIYWRSETVLSWLDWWALTGTSTPVVLVVAIAGALGVAGWRTRHWIRVLSPVVPLTALGAGAVAAAVAMSGPGSADPLISLVVAQPGNVLVTLTQIVIFGVVPAITSGVAAANTARLSDAIGMRTSGARIAWTLPLAAAIAAGIFMVAIVTLISIWGGDGGIVEITRGLARFGALYLASALTMVTVQRLRGRASDLVGALIAGVILFQVPPVQTALGGLGPSDANYILAPLLAAVLAVTACLVVWNATKRRMEFS